MHRVEIIGLAGVPLIETGDDLAGLIVKATRANDLTLINGDVVVVTSKVVSKAEGRWVDMSSVTPDEEAIRVGAECGKDPREVAVILGESHSISRLRQGVLIVRHRLGFVCANAGVDHSNTRPGEQWRLLLPADPDRSAGELRRRLEIAFEAKVGVVISDSHGRPFRMGTVGVGIGSSGLPALWDWRGQPDLFGSRLRVTEVGFADELAAAAGMVLGQSNEAIPAAIIRGLSYPVDETSRAADLLRPIEYDLYHP